MRALIYQTGSLGDTIVSLPAITAIRETLGESYEVWLLHERRPNVVTPEAVLAPTRLVDRYLSYSFTTHPLGRLLAGAGLMRRIRHLRFAKVFYVVGSKRPTLSVRRDAMFFSLCGIREKFGFRAVAAGARSPRDKDGFPARVSYEGDVRLRHLMADGLHDISAHQRHLKLELFGEKERDAVGQRLASARRYPARPLIAICPGTNMPAKRWPMERFIEVGRQLLATDQYELVIVGGKGDRNASAELLHAWGSGIDTCGTLTVAESAALLSLCRLCISLDSGPAHLSSAVGTPCVALFSGRDYPGRWDPPQQTARVLRNPVLCGGCMAETCRVPGHDCMSGLTAAYVWSVVSAELNRA